MSIVELSRVTVIGRLEDKRRVLGDLQRLGCLHLVPLRRSEGVQNRQIVTPGARDAFEFLLSCPSKAPVSSRMDLFDAGKVEQEALELRRRLLELEDRRDFLRTRIQGLRPWGNFNFPPLEDLGGVRFWFYVVPHYELCKIESLECPWVTVGRDNRFCYVVVLAADEPQGMPVERTHTGSRSLKDLEAELSDVELKLEEIAESRRTLTRWLGLFARSIHILEDQEALEKVMHETHDEMPLFVLTGWVPRERSVELEDYACRNSVLIDLREPQRNETPPTLLRNKGFAEGGQDLVSFYLTPSYWLWDPSTVVFYSFAVFFAMILSDAAYASVLGLGVLLRWKKMGRSALGRRMQTVFAALTLGSIIWGILVGSYFGVAPPPGSLGAAMQLFDMNDMNAMMGLSIIVGVIHLIIGNLGDWYRRRQSADALVPLGWIAILFGGVLAWVGGEGILAIPPLERAGYWLLVLGAAAILLFAAPQAGAGSRLLKGLLELTKLSAAFGDALSYLRLFALGLASASLAAAFNNLAAQVSTLVPGVGLLLALLILIIGHILNFGLSVFSGVIHGLRLNFIEFFRWGIPEEGTPFRPFACKEELTWNR